MKRVYLTTAALAAAVVVFTLVSLPPPTLALQTTFDDGTVAGAIHVHTNRSDGRSSPAEIADAAARAGLKFIVFTDHGDATRTPDPPQYRSGVLCLDGVEISTNGGHYVAMDMPASPYPLAGEARDVVEDVRRLGGFGIAAHPDSPKAELRWRDWSLPIDGVELLNPDSSWRVHAGNPGLRPKLNLLRAVFTYPIRPSETIARLLVSLPSAASQFDRITARRRVVALAGVDAHAKLALKNVDPGDNRFSFPVPGYKASLRVLSIRVRPDQALTGDAAADAARLTHAIRGGHLYTAIDGWASPPAFSFSVANREGKAEEGDQLRVAGDATLHVRSNAPPGFTTTVWHGAERLADVSQAEVELNVGANPGVYRVEIGASRRADAPPWITSNPIYLQPTTTLDAEPLDEAGASAPAPRQSPAMASVPLFDGHSLAGWNTESDRTSMAAVDLATRVTGAEVRLRYGLSGGSNTGQFSGATVETPNGVANFDRITFTIRAERPMRISVQARATVSSAAPERWQRSIYVDGHDRTSSVFFSDMKPMGETHVAPLPLAAVRTVMFVVDTTNTKPGASGRVWIREPKLQR